MSRGLGCLKICPLTMFTVSLYRLLKDTVSHSSNQTKQSSMQEGVAAAMSAYFAS